MKNMIKIVNILIIAIILINIFSIQSYAAISISGIKSDADGFLNKGSEPGKSPISISEMADETRPIAAILTTIGSGVLLICATVIGIKYIFANPDEQAKLKKQMVGLVVSAFVIFGAYNIWRLLYNFLDVATK